MLQMQVTVKMFAMPHLIFTLYVGRQEIGYCAQQCAFRYVLLLFMLVELFLI